MEGKDIAGMTAKSSFHAEEWRLTLSSPMLAGMAMTLADPGGLGGTVKDGVSGASAASG
jgi:hypothetical protein